ncbi:prepilin-type N-terminal cleavage/methylation domain-containing protein [Nitrincola tapanii]|uniref:Prepilin-type N-terminal cleavage/methylation domain-containing protein n=1 Tax=Nitrincola tapanii TaxID=1708751 RepID=A0A5A9W6M2_9GAMM|nr:prepilin-type N-terminal cleavage/methylation domain-containing protein [Nitrincola tapanii]KAA0876332.1 prepilin-type N-terminal cleavage/methylation domain-containing protein [Nitrincola tapanii]
MSVYTPILSTLPLQHAQAGFNLIEIMISLLIFSSLSLALTQLQLNSLHASIQSYQEIYQHLQAQNAQELRWAQRCEFVSASSLLNDAERVISC